MKTLAELKRDAKSGTLYGEMIVRNGENDIPDKLKGKRNIVDANSVGIKFLNIDGKKSELQIKCASLIEYDDNSLTIFNSGYRDLNDEEQNFMNKWNKIVESDDYKQRAKIDMMSDGNSTYWQKKRFFTEGGYEYLLGYDEIRGLKYDYNSGKIRDNKIKGNVNMKYIIYREV